MSETTCSICKSQGRETTMFETASGVLVCPICDRNVPRQPTTKGSNHD